MNNYDRLSDAELIEKYRGGEEAAMEHLMEKYRPLVKKRAKMLFLVGGDSDDLNQEGMIGLYKAIRDYDAKKDATFSTFAALCVSRQMYTAIEAAGRKKHIPLNSSLSLDSGDDLEDILGSLSAGRRESDPEYVYIDQESAQALNHMIRNILSSYEMQVLELYVSGMNSAEIAQKLAKNRKSVDNAIGRIRMKLQAAFKSESRTGD